MGIFDKLKGIFKKEEDKKEVIDKKIEKDVINSDKKDIVLEKITEEIPEEKVIVEEKVSESKEEIEESSIVEEVETITEKKELTVVEDISDPEIAEQELVEEEIIPEAEKETEAIVEEVLILEIKPEPIIEEKSTLEEEQIAVEITETEPQDVVVEPLVDQLEEEIKEKEVIPEPNLVEVVSEDKKKEKLDVGLQKTKENFFNRISRAVAGKSTIDELVLDDIEEALITSDIGVDTTLKIIEKLEERVERDKYINSSELNNLLKNEISNLMKDSYEEIPEVDGPYVIMVVGVNGVGKTTTIGKLAHKFKQEGKKVVLGAADTFRAAAVDQLVIWSERVGVDIVKQDMGSDPASVTFDTLQSAKANNADVVIIDTAGRLHNNINLMKELGKIRNVMSKIISNAPHDVMLVLDASTGQNAIEQATQFTASTEVNSITLTKLDGTAKGGVVIGISDQFNIPVRYIGVGEGIEDLQQFNKNEFVDSLFN